LDAAGLAGVPQRAQHRVIKPQAPGEGEGEALWNLGWGLGRLTRTHSSGEDEILAYRLVVAGLAVVLLMAGRADRADPSGAVDGDASSPGPSAQASAVNCGGSVYGPTALSESPPASSLPVGPAGAVDDAGAPAFDPSKDWKVVHQSDDRVDLVGELDEPVDKLGGDVRTHASRTLERITGAGNVADGTWLLTSAGPCAQRRVTDDDLGHADLALAAAPSPEDTSIDLLVTERACASKGASSSSS